MEEAQIKLKKIADSDPLNFKSLGRFKRSGVIDTQYNLQIYILLVIIPTFVIIAIALRILAILYGLANGTPEQEIQQIMDENIQQFKMQIDEKQNQFLQSYAEKMPDINDTFVLQQNNMNQSQQIINPFKGYDFGFLLVPPEPQSQKISLYQYQKEKLFHKMSLVSDSEAQNSIESEFYDVNRVGDIFSDSASPVFLKWERSINSNLDDGYNFKNFTFSQSNLAEGDSQWHCLGLQVSRQNEQFNIQEYYQVKGFDQCWGAVQGHGQWQKSFPQFGLNFKTWIQKIRKLDLEDQDLECQQSASIIQNIKNPNLQQQYSENSEIKNKNQCFSYLILKKICILVKYQKERDYSDLENSQYQWTFTGGCFDDGQSLFYEQAIADQIYEFKELQIEVRFDHRESDFFQKTQTAQIGNIFTQNSQKTSENEFQLDLIKFPKSLKQFKEQMNELLEKFKKNEEVKMKKGQISAQGLYLIYRFGLFASNIFFILGAVSFISLISYTIGMMCGEPNHIDSNVEIIKLVNSDSNEIEKQNPIGSIHSSDELNKATDDDIK